jgi:ATP-dependent protease ClpP protease subunit
MNPEPAIRALAPSEQAITAASRLGGEILLYGEIGRAVTVASVADALRSAPPGKVRVRINSGGGKAIEGIAIFALLRARGCDVIIDHIAASAASLVAMAGQTITMAPSSLIMVHATHLAIGGEAGAFRDASERLAACDQIYAKIYAERTGKTPADIEALTARETWLSPPQAIELGFADRIGDGEAPVSYPNAPIESRITREALTIGDAHRLTSPSGGAAFYRAMMASEAELVRLAFAASPEMIWALDIRDRLTDRPAEPGAEVWLEGRPSVPRLERGPNHFGEEWLFLDEAARMTAGEVAAAWRAAVRDKNLIKLLIRNTKNEFCEAAWLGQDDLAAELRAKAAHLLRIDRCIENTLAVLAIRQSEFAGHNPLKGNVK